ncbi:L-type lectin-domain containing receptor kinase IV.1-like [Papaver somniferum]|uniref:L-type lectin-domain containing receptor kinase IV.1-like n=1 Tax=Papaver somniferum TaxID=3469 RepID=UPI000E6F54D4|nr:L-type lectin-domain containing receptor kinase IV.1-like [Papaver somniferum]
MLVLKKFVMVLGVVMLCIVASPSSAAEAQRTDLGFLYNGFKDADAHFNFDDGVADITSNGLLRLTNNFNNTYQIGHAFYSRPFRFKKTIKQNSSSSSNTSTGGSVLSFSTTFVFSIIPENRGLSGQGIAFVIAPKGELPGARASIYLGLFNSTNNGRFENHVLAVELDTIFNDDFDDINGEHVGIDINNLNSTAAKSSGYTDNNRRFHSISLISGDPIQVWIEYDAVSKKLNVTLAPITVSKPDTPLLSYDSDLSTVILEEMYVGFSSSTSFVLTSHYIMGWSFMIDNGTAAPISASQLPDLPKRKASKSLLFGVELPIIIPVILLTFIIGILVVVRKIRNEKFKDVVEDWELDYGRQRFSYKDLCIATKGFKEKELLGIGGFGRVYKGELPTSKTEIAVKRVSHNSKQGEREFIAEIISIGNLRHRNLVQLLGYCRRNRELLLVYEFMPNGSLDKFIFRTSNSTSTSPVLSWNQRFQIIKGVASGLIYLHEEWEKVVIHRDIKASNVLLDGEMNARLGDFGLSRLYDRGTNPRTTNVVGTLGYIAPEMIKTGRATTSSDVYSFGAFLLEVACGRRPIEMHKSETEEGEVLVDWVLYCWRSGRILQTSDPNLMNEYVEEEMELVLKIGLLCSRNNPKARPSMRQVMQYLDGDVSFPETELWRLDYDDPSMSSSSGERPSHVIEMVSLTTSSRSTSVAESLLSGPR